MDTSSPDYPPGLIVPPRRRKASEPKPEPTEGGREVMNVEEAAEFLGLGLTTVYRELKRGLPCRKLGKRRLFLRSDLLKWVSKLPTR
jgi:excisionase family DNA binding protein